jgi:Protein of unknown function (DUF3618)
MSLEIELRNDQLRRERAELSATVQALAEKLDFPTRARQVAADVRGRAGDRVAQGLRSRWFVPAVVVAAVSLAAVIGARIRRRG